MRFLIISLIAISLQGCAGLPKHGQRPNEIQIKKCERLGDVALAMYGGGTIVGLGGFLYGAVSRDKTGFVIFGGGWASGMVGLGILGYMQHFTSCPMP